jgi:assimilatory nitrate reductase catalytic subunit
MNAPAQHPPTIRTTCPYCGVGCGVLAAPDGRGGAAISGDPAHPANFGRLCSKGSALGETLGLETRLLHPMQRQPDGSFVQTSWDSALDQVAGKFMDVVRDHGPEAVAFYLSGQLLTEDYYVANKLMKGFLGSANVDTNSRLCMASSVAGHRRAFGADTVPGTYSDLDQADLIVLVGSNTAWCHPILFQRMAGNRRERGAKIVVIDPRRTATTEEADLFLPVKPGMDTVVFSGLLAFLADRSKLDHAYIDAHTEGFDKALARAREIAPDIQTVSRLTGLAGDVLASFFALFAATEKVVTCYSQGVNQSAQGTDKVNAIINCHLATGRIGKPGMGPFSLTGQPNAMGGREVGGLANQLAAHMNFTPPEVERVGRFWNATRMARREGLKAVQMFEAISQGKIKALWVMATNPAVSLPDAGRVRNALRNLDALIVSENVRSNDTVSSGAHILLPAAAWAEKDGTVTNSERRISRQRAFLPLPGEARPDWWIVSEVARRMGFGDAFPYTCAADIFREHAALSAFENDGTRDFDIGALAEIDNEEFDRLDPVQWPQAARSTEETRFFAQGDFFTANRKARFIAPDNPALKEDTSEDYPLRLNTGRVRDQWHTMTRTGLSPRLGNHLPEPYVEVHPEDAARYGLQDGGFARLNSRYGSSVLKIQLNDGQQRGSVFVPIHWNDETASLARIGELVMPATDPFSGQPEAKATPVAIAPQPYRLRGFALAKEQVTLPAETWWSRVALNGGRGVLLASNDSVDAWQAWAQQFAAGAELAEYLDAPRDTYRVAAFKDGRLLACLFVGPTEAAPQWDAVKSLFESESLEEHQRRVLLSGKSADGPASAGPVICACFGVPLGAIRNAIVSGEACDVASIGKALRAGTNCGSCLPELKKIVAQELAQPKTDELQDERVAAPV